MHTHAKAAVALVPVGWLTAVGCSDSSRSPAPAPAEDHAAAYSRTFALALVAVAILPFIKRLRPEDSA